MGKVSVKNNGDFNSGASNIPAKKKKRKKSVPFSKTLCGLFLFVCKIASKFFRCRSIKSDSFKHQKKAGPMLVLANHVSALDFIYFTAQLYGMKTNFVVAENMMYSTPVFAKLLTKYHAIFKRQYYADFHCIKNIKKYLDAGISVVLCPEGKVSADGKTGSISSSIARLVQWLGYPVGVVKISGASMVRPKWAYTLRRGRVEAKCDMLLDADETKSLDKNEIYLRILAALDNNEHEWQVKNGVVFKGKRYAEGLERLLYKCPKCGQEFTMCTKGDILLCNACGNEIRYCNTGELVAQKSGNISPDRIDLFFDMQRNSVAKEVLNPNFCLKNKVHLFIENKERNGYKYIAKGELRLDREHLLFHTDQRLRPDDVEEEFRINGMDFSFKGMETEPIEEEFFDFGFSIKNYDTIAALPGTSVDMYDDKHVYRFMFYDEIASTKYVLAIEELYKLRHNKESV